MAGRAVASEGQRSFAGHQGTHRPALSAAPAPPASTCSRCLLHRVQVTVGKLYMVDLAGSERLKKSKSVGLRATEARSINLSLTMLGMCIQVGLQRGGGAGCREQVGRCFTRRGRG